nr:immunoglobulin heavy chain junction region [Mus musculus]
CARRGFTTGGFAYW